MKETKYLDEIFEQGMRDKGYAEVNDRIKKQQGVFLTVANYIRERNLFLVLKCYKDWVTNSSFQRNVSEESKGSC